MPTGSCLCHQLKYEYTGDPVSKAICHCLSCRKISGGAHTTNLLIPEDNFHVKSPPPKRYTETHESGMKLTVHFCDNCGCAVWKKADHELFKGAIVLLAGTLDNPEELEQAKPEVELYTKYRVSWLPKIDHIMEKQAF